MHHSYGKMHPTAEAVSFHVAVTSGFCPGLLKGHISESTEVDPGLRPGFQNLTVPLISTKRSFCALSPIHVNRGYSWGAQMLLGTHILGWTVLVVAMTTEPKLHNQAQYSSVGNCQPCIPTPTLGIPERLTANGVLSDWVTIKRAESLSLPL